MLRSIASLKFFEFRLLILLCLWDIDDIHHVFAWCPLSKSKDPRKLLTFLSRHTQAIQDYSTTLSRANSRSL